MSSHSPVSAVVNDCGFEGKTRSNSLSRSKIISRVLTVITSPTEGKAENASDSPICLDYDSTPTGHRQLIHRYSFFTPLLLHSAIKYSESVVVHSILKLPDLEGRVDDFIENLSENPDRERFLFEPNANGSNLESGSLCSEVMSCELVCRALKARLFKTEMQLQYWPCSSQITDYALEIPILNTVIAVSVTRLVKPQHDYSASPFNRQDAAARLKKKLAGIQCSTENCINAPIKQQILHAFAPDEETAAIACLCFCNDCTPEEKGNTIFWVTVAPSNIIYQTTLQYSIVSETT
eukprot:GCRY01000415.1.p1 GENE.GCRY01000415.1~~GCRY01000415.1.p1  ORF type:complete len:293 (+),score=53.14 GCRY01000415.1:336-1214(+)